MKDVLGFIGVGDLALYTIKGLRRGGYAGRICLSPRNRHKVEYLRQNCECAKARDNNSVVGLSDYVVLATRPQDCLDALSGLKFRDGQLLISVVAGVKIAQLRSAIAADIEIVRAMPVSSAEAGASPTLIYPDHGFVRKLFDFCGNTIAVDDEEYFDQGTILACVYSWYFSLFQALIDATTGPRLPTGISAELVMGMAKGAAELALASENHPGEIAAAVATEGTFSKLGLDLLKDKNAFGPWREACKLLEKRLAET